MKGSLTESGYRLIVNNEKVRIFKEGVLSYLKLLNGELHG